MRLRSRPSSVSLLRVSPFHLLISIPASGAVRRPVGKRNVLSLLGHSSPGDIADDEDEPMSENDGGVGSGDNEEDDEVCVNFVAHGTPHTLSNRVNLSYRTLHLVS